ncbi:unnamed protein product, partial [Rotaria socialis]
VSSFNLQSPIGTPQESLMKQLFALAIGAANVGGELLDTEKLKNSFSGKWLCYAMLYHLAFSEQFSNATLLP